MSSECIGKPKRHLAPAEFPFTGSQNESPFASVRRVATVFGKNDDLWLIKILLVIRLLEKAA